MVSRELAEPNVKNGFGGSTRDTSRHMTEPSSNTRTIVLMLAKIQRKMK